jgi:hypothetical protein
VLENKTKSEELKGRGDQMLTSCNGTSGGPAAMSADFVPGWMRRLAFASKAVCSTWAAWRAALGPISGDLGPI